MDDNPIVIGDIYGMRDTLSSSQSTDVRFIYQDNKVQNQFIS